MTLKKSVSDVDFIKSGHTLSLNSHNIEPTNMVHSRSSRVLLSRGSAFPALPADLSSEFTNENMRRRTAHQDVMTADHTSFRRRAFAEGTSSILNEKRLVKDFLCDVHKLKDLKDINKKQKDRLTFSIRMEKDKQEGAAHEEYKFNTLRPLEDFIRPEDTNSPRQTGYEHGHIRSLLKLDVYGPASSQLANRERAIGKVPRTPNMDRYSVSEAANGPCSPTSRVSTASTVSSYEFAEVRGGKNTMAKRALKYNTNDHSSLFGTAVNGSSNVDMRQMHNMFHQSSNSIVDERDVLLVTRSSPAAAVAAGDKLMVNFHHTFSNPTTAALLTQEGRRRTSSTLPESCGSFQGRGISSVDRLPLDPLLKRTLWFKTFTKNEQDRKNDLQAVRKESRHQQEQRLLAESERRSLEDFETHLTLARIQV